VFRPADDRPARLILELVVDPATWWWSTPAGEVRLCTLDREDAGNLSTCKSPRLVGLTYPFGPRRRIVEPALECSSKQKATEICANRRSPASRCGYAFDDVRSCCRCGCGCRLAGRTGEGGLGRGGVHPLALHALPRTGARQVAEAAGSARSTAPAWPSSRELYTWREDAADAGQTAGAHRRA